MKKTKNCLDCGKLFFKNVNTSKKEWERRVKWCSRECYRNYIKGKPLPHLKNFQFKKGEKTWNYGLLGLKEEKSPSWKGEDVGYSGLHKWVALKLGKPKQCELCLKTTLNPYQIHWANKSHQYKRELTDWIRLCASCHLAYDRKQLV